MTVHSEPPRAPFCAISRAATASKAHVRLHPLFFERLVIGAVLLMASAALFWATLDKVDDVMLALLAPMVAFVAIAPLVHGGPTRRR